MDQQIERRPQKANSRGYLLPDPVAHPLGRAHSRHHTQHGFNHHADTAAPSFTDHHVRRVAVAAMEALIPRLPQEAAGLKPNTI